MEPLSQLTPQSLIQHEAFVLRLARSLTRDEAEARDLTQDTWIAAMANPPRTERVRGWLAQVVRNRAYDLSRSDRRRKDREQRSARPEAQSYETSSSEQLELHHDVVTAVLALEEPYRAAVIAVYYRGLSPTEYAKQLQLSPSTVRSQLSRALGQMRGKLDREHGSRDAWSVALAGLCAERLSPPAAAGGLVWGAWIAGAAAAGTIGVVLLWKPAAPQLASETAALETVARQKDSNELRASAEPKRRTSVTATEEEVANATKAPLSDDPEELLERMRQIKTAILDRALQVDPDIAQAYAHLGAPPLGGVVRLLDREHYGRAFDLPWMRQGGSYYSFTSDIHDFNTLPQICLSWGGLLADGDDAVLLDLGELPLDQVPRAPQDIPDGLTFSQSLDWRSAWTDLGTHQRTSDLSAARDALVNSVYESKLEGWQDIEAGRYVRTSDKVRPAVGHSYLLRVRTDNEADVLVAFEVVQLDEKGCTLAWKLLRDWIVEDNSGPGEPAPHLERNELAPIPTQLSQLTTPELHAELERTRSAGHSSLYGRFPSELDSEIEALRSQPGVQVARLAHYMGAWDELNAVDVYGGLLSFTRGQTNGVETHLMLQRAWQRQNLHVRRDIGVLIDLGTTPLSMVDRNFVRNELRELGDLVLDTEFTSSAFDPEDWEQRRAVEEAESEARENFEERLRVHGLRNGERVPALAGHSYFARSVHFSDLDVSAVFHVLAVDEFGIVLAWRVLDSKVLRR